MLKLVVVTTTYNQENFIESTIKGVISQKTNFDFKYIISVDCSTDNTKKIIEKYQKKYPDIIEPIYNKKNLGAMENFIETLDKVKAEYVALCDGDDYWTDPNKLQMQVDFLEKNKKYNICFHQTKIFYEDKSKDDEIYPINIAENTTFNDLIVDNYIPTNTIVYRWQFNNMSFKNTFPKDIIPGDYFVHLYHAHTGKIHFIKKAMSAYRRHDKGMWWTTSKPGMENEFYIKHGEKFTNFYIEISKCFDLKDYYNDKINYLSIYTLVAYIKSKKKKLIQKYKENHPELYDRNFPLAFETCSLKSKSKKIFSLIRNNPKNIFGIIIRRFFRKRY